MSDAFADPTTATDDPYRADLREHALKVSVGRYRNGKGIKLLIEAYCGTELTPHFDKPIEIALDEVMLRHAIALIGRGLDTPEPIPFGVKVVETRQQRRAADREEGKRKPVVN